MSADLELERLEQEIAEARLAYQAALAVVEATKAVWLRLLEDKAAYLAKRGPSK